MGSCKENPITTKKCPLTHEKPEKCEAMSPTVTVESVNTESTLVVEVWLVVNITTESTLTSTIPVTLVRSVCDTSTETKSILLPNHQLGCSLVLGRRRRSRTIQR